jgi:hypothetical protein
VGDSDSRAADLPLPDVSQLRERPQWLPAIIATIIFDVSAAAAFLMAYLNFSIVELAYGSSPLPLSRLLSVALFAVFTQAGAVVAARRLRQPWIPAAWAAFVAVGAVFTWVVAVMSVGRIETVIR